MNKNFKATIKSLSHDGRGVTEINDKVAFVSYALPEETVELQITKKRSRFYDAVATEIFNKNPNRVAPRCQYFTRCGGCCLQHYDHKQQLIAKQNILLEQLSHFGKVTPNEILPPLYADPWSYRHKARLGIRYVTGKDAVLVGYRERNGRYIMDMEDCEILAKPGAKLIKPLRQMLSQFHVKDKIPQCELAVAENHCALVFRHLVPLDEHDLGLLKAFAIENDVVIYLQPKGPDTIHLFHPSDKAIELQYSLSELGLTFNFDATDFTQINTAVNQKMVTQALQFLALNENDHVLDLFCGLGNFTLPIAKYAKSATGVEANDALITKARLNANKNHLKNTQFYVGDLYSPPFQGEWFRQQYNKILLDPPRSGALEIVKEINAFAAEKIVYISCNPATLARDSEILVHQHGYQLTHAGIIDMFAHTHHTEAMAVFCRA